MPAPPEMAMRFLREGPGPFRPGGFDGGYQEEGNGGPRGGKRGAPGPMMGGGLLDVPPMMMPPHGMRRDPRGVRRLVSELSFTRSSSFYRIGSRSRSFLAVPDDGNVLEKASGIDF